MMKNLFRYIGGGIAALLFFCNVPAAQAANPVTIANIISVAQLTGGNWSGSPYLNLISYVAGKNKGGGLLYLVASDTTSATNFCTIFVDAAGNRFYREAASRLEAYQCGALGDGATTGVDGPALQHGIDAIRNGTVIGGTSPAPAGDFYVNSGHYLTAGTILNFGSTTPGTYGNISMIMHGAGRYATTIQNSAPGTSCAIDLYTAGPSVTISDMFVSVQGSSSNCSIDVEGNGQILTRLGVDSTGGIKFTSATDVQATDILADQPNGFVITLVGVNSDINIQGVESFGGTSQTNAGGILCNGASRAITISGYIANFLQGAGLTVAGGCKMSLDSYYMDSANNTSGGFPSIAYGIQATGVGTILTLGTGTVTGFQSNGLNIGTGATVIDNGASFIGNVLSTTVSDKYEVSITGGTSADTNYYKTGGRITGGSANEVGLVHIIGNTTGRLSLVGVRMDTAISSAIVVQNSAGPVNYFQLKDCDITNVNTGNSAANTPVSIGATTIATVNGNNINPANTVTSAITFNSGSTGIFTYNASHFGAFPANAGTVYSVGNVNY